VATPSPSGGEGAVVDLCEAEMRRLGFRTGRDRAGNLLGIVGEGTTRLLFDVHADTVAPPRGGGRPRIDGGTLHGRGSCDVKGPMAALIHGVADAARAGTLQATVGVAITTLEEVLEGAALAVVLDGFEPDGVVVVEPSRAEAALAQRGRAELVIDVAGRSSHAAYPEHGANALEAAAAVLTALAGREPPHDPELGAGILVATEAVTEPFPATSVVPARCRVRLDRRTLPGETAGDVLAELEPYLAAATAHRATATVAIPDSTVTTYTGVELSARSFLPAWRAGDEGFAQAVRSAVPAGRPAVFCTNASLCADRGVPTVIFGPGEPERAHQDDEQIDVADLERGRERFAALSGIAFPPLAR
jgi:acetylornithine deacetylase/succinyl-diaminopimelate desuccinylase-like protein